MYHNTTEESKEAVKKYGEIADNQDEVVLEIVKENLEGLGASEIHETLVAEYPNTPITSVRRSLNTLMNNAQVQKQGKKKGKYGRSEYIWAVID